MNKRIIKKSLNLVFLIIYLIVFINVIKFIDARVDYLLDCDISSELLLSKLVASEGRLIFSKNWYYSTELRVVNIQIIMSILFRFFSDWHFVRVLGNGILLLMMSATVYMCLQKLVSKNLAIIGSTLMLIPISKVYFYVVIYGLFYIPHITLSFVAIFFLIKIIQRDLLDKSSLLIACVISLLMGLGGYRYLLVLFGPICAASFTILIFNKDIKDKSNIRLFICCLTSSVFCFIGFLVNKLVLSQYFSYGFYSSVNLYINGFNKLKTLLIGFVNDFGYVLDLGTKARLITLLISLVLISLFVISSIYLLINKKTSKEKSFYVLFSVFNILMYIVVNMVTTMHLEDRYTILCTVFMIPTILIFINDIGVKYSLKTLIALLLVICFVIPSRYVLNYYKYNSTNGTLKEIVEYVNEVGYKDAYATVAYGNMITELSNGEIRTYKFESSYDEKATDFENLNVWLQRKDNDVDIPKGKVCLFLKYYNSGMDDHIIYWENDDAVVYGFDSYQEMKDVIYNLK